LYPLGWLHSLTAYHENKYSLLCSRDIHTFWYTVCHIVLNTSHTILSK
jgi:hypothetical protein